MLNTEISQAITWNTNRRWTLREFYKENKWPKIIRAELGYLGDTEEDTFGSEDTLILLGIKCFHRVTACKYEELPEAERSSPLAKLEERWIESYSLPLTTSTSLRGENLVKVLPYRGYNHRFSKVRDLTESFPRYVKANNPISITGPTSTLQIKVGDELELLKLEGRHIISIRNKAGGPVRLPLDTQGDFGVIEDTNIYTLAQVLERFPLPQRVVLKTQELDLHYSDIVIRKRCTYSVMIAVSVQSLIEKPEVRTPRHAYQPESDWSFLFFPVFENDQEEATSPLGDIYFYMPEDINEEFCQKILAEAKSFDMENFRDVNRVRDLRMRRGDLEKLTDSIYVSLSVQQCANTPPRKGCHLPTPPASDAESDEDYQYIPVERNQKVTSSKPPKSLTPPPILPKPLPRQTPQGGHGSEKSVVKKISKRKEKAKKKTGPFGRNTDKDDHGSSGTKGAGHPHKADIKNLSVTELAAVVEGFGMKEIAETLKQSRVDGKIFSELTPEMFKGRPFHASHFEVLMLERIQSGETPT